MEQRLKDVAEIRFCLSSKEISEEKRKILMPINLLKDNVIQQIVWEDKFKTDDTTKVSADDILVKRISPSFINYINDIDDDVYAAANIIIIKAVSVAPKYLAFILNEEIGKITQSLIGAKIPAISRGDLEEIQVPILPINEQIAIGELWYNSIELSKLRSKLNELESLKNIITLNRFIK